jgi:hypothetical protein
LLEDLWRLQPGTAINVFSRISGGLTRNPCFDDQWLKAHVTTEQRLPNLKGPGGKGVLFWQVQGYVLSNPYQHDILGRPVSDLSEIVTNTFQHDGIIVRCPAGPTGKDFDILLTFHELFFFPMCVFVQADLPFSSQWRSALQVQGADVQKLLLHRYIQEAGVDRTLMADALQQWRAIGSKAAALSSHQEILELQRELERVQKLQKVTVPTLLSDSVTTVCERIDTFLDETSYHCFGNFTNIHERLLTLSDMRSLTTMLKQLLPEIWDHYMAFLGYTERMQLDK